jgi:16S rRNA pseudouridine516 synthase
MRGVKLDRLLAKHRSAGRRQARVWVVEKRVIVDGVIAETHDLEVSRFSQVELDQVCIQAAPRRLHVMMHKPVGVLSATKDAQWPTVLDLIDDPDKETLHIAGRLDRGSSGLVLLTNDGSWSKSLMSPDQKVPKQYLVTTRDPIDPSAVGEFERGFYFHTEGIHTLPVRMEILAECVARLTLHEGRYHQIKRMFHRVGNRVVTLHRESIGGLALPADWQPGQWRLMDSDEIERAALAEVRS